ncbi:M4 family metallopeptidase [uncultured Nocardioides sp.]|uniref:M4 family metallopeptidase n=1 Tax=uncultured Nocardioides sp. TaxID=198441 RepID=UPI0026308525|nr:M4 family metallopeptidase [uncultured Nocardioides sp.]
MLVPVGASASLAVAALTSLTPPSAATAAPATAATTQAVATQRLTSDAAGGEVSFQRAANGDVTFVGTAAGAEIDNPSVRPSTSVTTAAQAHLSRYGAALGADRPGTTLVQRQVTPDVTGGDVVHFTQRVGGLPVVGGDVVVSLNADRELRSLASTMSSATRVPSPKVAETKAAALARAVGASHARAAEAGDIRVTQEGRWVLDQAVTGTPAPGVATVWRFELTAGSTHREVFVDDQTGGVLLDMDANKTFAAPGHLKRTSAATATAAPRARAATPPTTTTASDSTTYRIVCDNDSKLLSYFEPDPPCTTAAQPVRVEGQDPVGPDDLGNEDADHAYDNAGATSDLYGDLGVDLTDLIGLDIGDGTKALAQTVRMCWANPFKEDWPDDPDVCPYFNAYWDGRQMYYGEGFAIADDIVGHEMTHGVTEHTSNLFYWGESGAINESISDIMGEIVDLRHVTPGESPDNWAIGEDLGEVIPDLSEGIRNLENPGLFWQPARTQSGDWTIDDWDNGGVHTNSGVGNKTAYLIMNGGVYNGQSVDPIDTDQSFIKTASLFLLADQSLASGADYRALSAVLQQSCQTLMGVAGSGFTSSDCANVRKATLATQLEQAPQKTAKPADAPATCPKELPVRTVLFDSETGDSAAKLSHGADSVWGRDVDPYWGSNATSGKDSWHGTREPTNDYELPSTDSAALAQPVAVPKSGRTYLWFNGWYYLDAPMVTASPWPQTYDGGTVEIDDLSDAQGPQDAAGLPWINGPQHKIVDASFPWTDPRDPTPTANPALGRKAFGGNSYGWSASSVELTGFAGTSVRPQFTISTDNAWWFVGWFLDDITVFNCAAAGATGGTSASSTPAAPVKAGGASIQGKARAGKLLTAAATGWATGTTYAYQWLRDGKVIKGATAASYQIKKKDAGHKLTVVVTGTTSAGAATATAPAVKVRRNR